jgi:hypothetical protein
MNFNKFPFTILHKKIFFTYLVCSDEEMTAKVESLSQGQAKLEQDNTALKLR